MGQFLRSVSRTSFLEIWLPLCRLSLSFSLSLPLFFRLINWNAEALRVYLFAQASKTQVRGSLRWVTLRYSSGRLWPNVDGTSFLS